jgi:hypothetical protein
MRRSGMDQTETGSLDRYVKAGVAGLRYSAATHWAPGAP